MTQPGISLTEPAEQGSDIDVLGPMIQPVAQRADGFGRGRAVCGPIR